jgi:hypothetical protein
MLSTVLLTVGSVVPVLWGAAHIFPTKSIVAGFGQLSPDNKRILTMEWVAEGLTLIFAGALPGLALLRGDAACAVGFVVPAAAVMLLIMAGWSALTGARTSILPMRLCPVVKTIAAVCLIVGSVTA